MMVVVVAREAKNVVHAVLDIDAPGKLSFNPKSRRCCLPVSFAVTVVDLKIMCSLNSLTFQSTDPAVKPQQITEEEARSKAQQILQLFPGATNLRKATYATVTGGITAFLVANGIYIPNDETLILAAFILVTRVLYVKIGGPLANLIDSSINELRNKLMASRTTEIGSIGKEIQSLEELRDFAAITADLYETKRENAVLDAQLSEVLERQRFLASVKSKLDEAVRKSIERQAAERKAMIDAIMAGVMTELEDVKLQDRILKKCLFDLENVPSVQQARI